METWYFSPFPKEYYADGVVETVRTEGLRGPSYPSVLVAHGNEVSL